MFLVVCQSKKKEGHKRIEIKDLQNYHQSLLEKV